MAATMTPCSIGKLAEKILTVDLALTESIFSQALSQESFTNI